MRRTCYLLGIFLLNISFIPAEDIPPTLADYWDGKAEWVLDQYDVGLPVGESDTVFMGDGRYWSYLHASDQSAKVVDSCGQPVQFPGCTTLWQSDDGGNRFELASPICLVSCTTCPCDDERDHITAQQYPRVAFAYHPDGTLETAYMVYEWHAQTRLRTSPDGIRWTPGRAIRFPSGTWPLHYQDCAIIERIGQHPNIEGQADGCLVGAPPGIFVEDDLLYIFVGAGSAPAHMRCYWGNRYEAIDDPFSLTPCTHDPLFAGAREYGPLEVSGTDANPYFDFRYISSADVIRVGARYYMAYEGIRGPDILNRGWDTQFALGFARSITDRIDGPWETWDQNPALLPVSPNFGVGHADLLLQEGVTLMYTATSMNTRGRYRLSWRDANSTD